MEKAVKICGVQSGTSKKGKEYTVVHWVEKIPEKDDVLSMGFFSRSGFAPKLALEAFKKYLNKECTLDYSYSKETNTYTVWGIKP